ncbi:hypothetical protein EVAR_50355_1 [Eumeta japonica]|uniref:Uncharacterized protein n=1 Tax=Eumeta variegata TaxID=151549 RepID=A0A4C1XYB2_EUMVA|nr:hypothetical protein EVAR_50355_1 [Eumeta japonica]
MRTVPPARHIAGHAFRVKRSHEYRYRVSPSKERQPFCIRAPSLNYNVGKNSPSVFVRKVFHAQFCGRAAVLFLMDELNGLRKERLFLSEAATRGNNSGVQAARRPRPVLDDIFTTFVKKA